MEQEPQENLLLFYRVNFLRCLLFQDPFHTPVTTVAAHKKDPGHYVKSAGGRLQLNPQAPYVHGFV